MKPNHITVVTATAMVKLLPVMKTCVPPVVVHGMRMPYDVAVAQPMPNVAVLSSMRAETSPVAEAVMYAVGKHLVPMMPGSTKTALRRTKTLCVPVMPAPAKRTPWPSALANVGRTKMVLSSTRTYVTVCRSCSMLTPYVWPAPMATTVLFVTSKVPTVFHVPPVKMPVLVLVEEVTSTLLYCNETLPSPTRFQVDT